MGFIALICGFVGFVFAVKLSLLFQFIAIGAGALLLNSSYVSRMEMAALIPMFMFVAFVIGLAAGDLYYLVAFVPNIGDKVGSAAAWFFKP